MKPKVSVIVPVYNSEKTLAACLGNLVHQTLDDIEIILVNDASTDQSFSILSDCEHAFPNKVMLINCTTNGGPGGARNVGLSYARGEYIGFVDSDDVVDINMYETLYTLACTGNYDIVDTAFVFEAQGILRLTTPDSCTGILNARKKEQLLAEGGYLWSKLFRHELLEDLTFRSHVILEDMETLMLLFLRANSLGTCKTPLYRYSATPASASASIDPVAYHHAVTEAMKAVFESISSFFSVQPCSFCYSQVQNAVEYSIIYLYKCGMISALAAQKELPPPVTDAMLQELVTLRNEFVTIPLKNNSFLKEKLPREDYDFLLKLEN